MNDMKLENQMQALTAHYTALLHYLEGSQWSKVAEALSNIEASARRAGFVVNDILRP